MLTTVVLGLLAPSTDLRFLEVLNSTVPYEAATQKMTCDVSRGPVWRDETTIKTTETY